MIKTRIGTVFSFVALATGGQVFGQETTQNGEALPSLTVVSADASPSQRVIPFQGLLTTPNGAAVPDGAYNLTFKLYAAADSPTPLGGWSETYSGLSVVGGRFSVLLGTVRSLDNPDNDQQTNDAISFAQPVYLGIKVGTDAEMRPRKQLVPAVHAYRSTMADHAVDSSISSNALLLDGRPWNQLVPPGTIVAFGGKTVPQGWLKCDGLEKDIATYPNLYLAIENTWGTSSSEGKFRLPDLRGEFLRGVDDGRGRDRNPGQRVDSDGHISSSVGSFQVDATARPKSVDFRTYVDTPRDVSNNDGAHSHTLPPLSNGGGLVHDGRIQDGGTGGNHDVNVGGGYHEHLIKGGGDDETRPKNAYVYWIIKY